MAKPPIPTSGTRNVDVPAKDLPLPIVPEWRQRPGKTVALSLSWFGLLGFGWEMINNNEYAAAEFLFSVAACIFFYQIYASGARRTYKVLAVIFGVALFGVSALDGLKIKAEKPWSNLWSVPTPPVNQMKIRGFTRGDYELGNATPIQVHGSYLGSNAIDVKGWYCVYTILRWTPKDFESIWRAQEIGWHECGYQYKQIPDFSISQPFVWQLLGPPLVKQDFDGLNDGTATLLFMGQLNWSEGKDKFRTEFCAWTQRDRENYHFCQHHNGPVDVSR